LQNFTIRKQEESGVKKNYDPFDVGHKTRHKEKNSQKHQKEREGGAREKAAEQHKKILLGGIG